MEISSGQPNISLGNNGMNGDWGMLQALDLECKL